MSGLDCFKHQLNLLSNILHLLFLLELKLNLVIKELLLIRFKFVIYQPNVINDLLELPS
jgi:hypothetical protein